MAAPWRTLVCLISTITLLLAGSPGLLEAALLRVRPVCHCGEKNQAHAACVDDTARPGHSHDAEDTDDDPAGDGVLTDDHTHCPCCPLRPGGSCGGCCLVKAPFFTV